MNNTTQPTIPAIPAHNTKTAKTQTITPATTKQIDFIASLAKSKDLTKHPLNATIDSFIESITKGNRIIGKGIASDLINELIKLPSTKFGKTSASGPELPQITAGYYTLGESVYKVQKSPETGNHYAKVLVDGHWTYTQGAITKLKNGSPKPLTLDEAKAYGKLYGLCIICGRTLTDEYSIANGIGPICAEKF